MTTKHEPPDSVGDCFRCCIASILDLRADQVPHFFEGEAFDDESGRIGIKRLQDFLQPMGLYYFECEFDAKVLAAWTEYLDCHYVFSGKGPRGHRHATVGRNGAMAHDPHPSRGGVIPDEGKYQIGFVVKR